MCHDDHHSPAVAVVDGGGGSKGVWHGCVREGKGQSGPMSKEEEKEEKVMEGRHRLLPRWRRGGKIRRQATRRAHRDQERDATP